MSLFSKLFGGPEPPEISLVADITLGRREEPSRLASSAGVTWRPDLQKEWDKRFARCAGCQVWIRGKRSLWCDYCKIKGI